MRNRMRTAIVTGALLSLAALNVHAQAVKIATGGKDGTYNQMFNQLISACGTASGLAFSEVETNGSVSNTDLLAGNKVHGALVQADVLEYRAMTAKNLPNQVKVLFPLHKEEVHLVALAAGKKEGGWGVGKWTVGGSQVVLTDFSQIAGRPVGAVGGSAITARFIAANSGVDFQIIEFNKNDEMLAALQEKKIDVAIMVMGYPAPLIAGLSKDYRLLPITGKPVRELAKWYTPTQEMTYENLSDSQGVDGIATQALFVVQDYKSKRMVDGLNKFRECKAERLPDIQEELGNHPKWKQVDNDTKVNWPLYNQQ